MHERAAEQAAQQQKAFDSYVKQAAGSGSNVDQLAKLADLKPVACITDAEFEAQKAKLLCLTATTSADARSGAPGAGGGHRRVRARKRPLFGPLTADTVSP